MKKYLKLLRVSHYIKNLLVFFPLFFSQQLFTKEFVRVVLAFICFSLVSSVIYIINDIRDVESDRKHTVKCKRPIAAGEISVRFAIFITVALLGLVIGIGYFTFNSNALCWLMLSMYFVVNIGYSMGLKKVPIVDITLLVMGFMIRVLYGAVVINVEVSNWLYLTVMSMAFYLSLAKRRNEFSNQKNSGTRAVLQHYNYEFLDKNMYVFLGLAIVFYSLWCIDPTTVKMHSNPYLIWTVPIVVVICLKYNLVIESESQGDPVDVIFSDKILLLLLMLYVVAVFATVYF
jgi:4-hydroxybenzoate polyprenyltransferase